MNVKFTFNLLYWVFLISIYFLMKILKGSWKFRCEGRYILQAESFLLNSFLPSFYLMKSNEALPRWTISIFLSMFFEDPLSMHLRPLLNLPVRNMLARIELQITRSMENNFPCFLLKAPLKTIFYPRYLKSLLSQTIMVFYKKFIK